MFVCIHQEPNFNIDSLCSKKPTSNMRKEIEESDRRVQRRISKFYVQILLLLVKVLAEPRVTRGTLPRRKV
jgi:hypothetical protein